MTILPLTQFYTAQTAALQKSKSTKTLGYKKDPLLLEIIKIYFNDDALLFKKMTLQIALGNSFEEIFNQLSPSESREITKTLGINFFQLKKLASLDGEKFWNEAFLLAQSQAHLIPQDKSATLILLLLKQIQHESENITLIQRAKHFESQVRGLTPCPSLQAKLIGNELFNPRTLALFFGTSILARHLGPKLFRFYHHPTRPRFMNWTKQALTESVIFAGLDAASSHRAQFTNSLQKSIILQSLFRRKLPITRGSVNTGLANQILRSSLSWEIGSSLYLGAISIKNHDSLTWSDLILLTFITLPNSLFLKIGRFSFPIKTRRAAQFLELHPKAHLAVRAATSNLGRSIAAYTYHFASDPKSALSPNGSSLYHELFSDGKAPITLGLTTLMVGGLIALSRKFPIIMEHSLSGLFRLSLGYHQIGTSHLLIQKRLHSPLSPRYLEIESELEKHSFEHLLFMVFSGTAFGLEEVFEAGIVGLIFCAIDDPLPAIVRITDSK